MPANMHSQAFTLIYFILLRHSLRIMYTRLRVRGSSRVYLTMRNVDVICLAMHIKHSLQEKKGRSRIASNQNHNAANFEAIFNTKLV
jgi:hypothetical protein